MQTVVTSWRIIEKVLWQNVHSVFQALGKPATDVQIARLVKRLSFKLPSDFVRSLKTHDGLRDSYLGPNRLFDNYALLPVSAIISVYRMMCDLQAECEFGGSLLEGNDPRIRNDEHWRAGWIPIMDADGDKLVLDLDPAPAGLSDRCSSGSTAAVSRYACSRPRSANGSRIWPMRWTNAVFDSTSMAGRETRPVNRRACNSTLLIFRTGIALTEASQEMKFEDLDGNVLWLGTDSRKDEPVEDQ